MVIDEGVSDVIVCRGRNVSVIVVGEVICVFTEGTCEKD
jgi:hypothetical protein